MLKLLFILSTLGLTSCGGLQKFAEKSDPKRQFASVDSISISNEKFSQDLDQKLMVLHIHYTLGQKNLEIFDAEIETTPIEKMYQNPSYLRLLVIRAQAEEIEHQILDDFAQFQNNKKMKGAQEKLLLMSMRISKFSLKSRPQAWSMENLVERLGLQHQSIFHSLPKIRGKHSLTSNEINQEIQKLKDKKEFQVSEKNIEHLSYMMDTKMTGSEKRFYPSSTRSGNITGNEFPAKVWSLTFDDGPGKATSPIILENLKKRGIKATFFQLTQQVNALPSTAKSIRDAGMEIASHSYSHAQLTKVGTQTLEKEITTAVNDLKKVQEVEIKFFRLPYGAGVSTPSIRQKIAGNDLIHVFWNIDTLDWMAQTPDKIVTRTKSLMKKTAKDAGVILFHDIHKRTTQATPEIMDFLKQDGRRVCTLNEIVTQMNEGAETVCPPK